MQTLWSCDQGYSEVQWLAETEDVRVVLRSPQALAAIQTLLQQQACAEHYNSLVQDPICVTKTLAPEVAWDGREIRVNHLQRSSWGRDWQFLSGPYSPFLEPIDGAFILHLRHAVMPGSKTLIQWDDPLPLQDCREVQPFPAAPVSVAVLGDAYAAGHLVSTPLAGVVVYAGDWRGGVILGATDAMGTLALQLPIGMQTLSVFQLTSSHSALWSEPVGLRVTAQKGNALVIHVAPTTVRISTTLPVAYGRALYLTGEGDALGNWQTATRLSPLADGRWELAKNLPIGAAYKLVEAPWSDYPAIATSSGVRWEVGPNHVIPPKNGYYEVVIRAEPVFE